MAWSLMDGALLPYEWRFVPYVAELPEELDQTTSWVKSFMKLVNDSGLSGPLSLSAVPPKAERSASRSVEARPIS
jgi:hypothetical protein